MTTTRAALIGLGMVSRTFGDAFVASDIDLAAVFARSDASRVRFIERFPKLGANNARSVEEIAADPTIDFVVLATPPNARSEIVDILLAHNKPILMEKPVERTLEAATALVERCEDSNVSLGIVLQHRARPILEDLCREQATLGQLAAVEVNVPWWRPQRYYDDPGRGSYERDGGGVLISQAIHTLDLMLSITGRVSEVTAMSATTALHQMEGEDFVSAGLRFDEGAVGQLFATTASFPGQGETITLHYAQGSARLAAGQLRVDRHDGTSTTFGANASSGAGADPMAFTSDWHRLIIDDFAEAIRDDRPPLVPGREALKVHRLIAAIEQSARSGERTAVSA